MTLAIFRTEGNCPVEKDILKISLNCWEMSFFSSFKIFTGMLFGPDNLWESREDINGISFLSVGVKKKVKKVWIRKTVCVMFWWTFYIRVCFLSYRSEVVIKDITHSSRICNGFVVKLNGSTLEVIFLIEIIVLILFQVFLMLFQLFSKYFV